jgi:hypothetical protein
MRPSASWNSRTYAAASHEYGQFCEENDGQELNRGNEIDLQITPAQTSKKGMEHL